jgi:hypothetical protein
MEENIHRRESLKHYRHQRSDELKTILSRKKNDLNDDLLANEDEMKVREYAFGK